MQPNAYADQRRQATNKAAVNTHNKARKKYQDSPNKYLNNIVEQAQRSPERIIKPMLGFNSLKSVQYAIADIELARMLHKGRACPEFAENLTPAEQFTIGCLKRVSLESSVKLFCKFGSLRRNPSGAKRCVVPSTS